jgi:hypothetical protein
MLDLGHDDLRIGEKAFALVAHDTGKVVDMAMGEDDRVDVLGLDAGRRQGILQPPGCRSERFIGSHTAVEKNELVAGVQHKAIFLDYKSGGRLELACNHAFDGFLGRLRKKRCGGT